MKRVLAALTAASLLLPSMAGAQTPAPAPASAQPQTAQPAPAQPTPAQSPVPSPQPPPTSGPRPSALPYTPGQPYQPQPVYRAPVHPDLPSRSAGDRVAGGRGSMSVLDASCAYGGVTPATRRRIVALAAGEWSTFGFPVLDLTHLDRVAPAGPDFEIVPEALNPVTPGRVQPRLLRLGEMEDDARVRAQIGGYWAATPGGSSMVEQQNRVWQVSGGTAGWAQPWSAAFISWVMCEAGLGGDARLFQRSDSHWNYIDQAIAGGGAFTALDLGQAAISPGDMLCFSNDRNYRSIAERRAQLGQGFASHCDIVVKLDPARERIYLIGGNVSQAATMTMARAARRAPGGPLVPFDDRAQPGSRNWFAHLRLNAGPVADNVFDSVVPVTNVRVLAASQGLLQPAYPALQNPPRVAPPAAPPPGPTSSAVPALPPRPAAAPPPAPAAVPPSTPVPNPPGS